MTSNCTYVMRWLLLLPVQVILTSNVLFGQTGTARGVATFECIGITWSGSGGNASTVCNVKYRVAGSGSAWSNGYPLWFDSRAAGSGSSAARPANEYRGSLVNLSPGTTYEIELSLQGNPATNTFTCATWSENFPVGATNTVASRSTTLNITTSGTANAYQLYTGNATIDVNNGADNCVYINAAYIIVRGLTLKGAKADAIKLGPNAHDVVIEYNDISGWGRSAGNAFGMDGDAGVRVSYAPSVERVIIQRNKIHHPRNASNSWAQNHSAYNTYHPAGPQGITFETAGGNHVIRYNEIYSDAAHYFNDGIGGAENFSYEGFPRANSDIYGNKVSQVWDDGIESEGGNMNVRIWGNYLDSTYVKIAIAGNSIGPIYIFRNVANYSRRSAANDAATVDNEDRGPFIKAGTSNTQYNGAKTYIFHNTILQPVVAGYQYSWGCGGGIQDWGGGPMTGVESRNNILHIHKNWWQSIGDSYSNQTNNDFNYDLYNGSVTASNGQERNGWSGVPAYSAGSIQSGWPLASNSKGYNVGAVLNNFNDGYTGTAPDAGAYEAGLAPLEFGINAYSTAPPPPPPPPPPNQPPVADAGNDITITLPVIIATLDGSASTDADGTIVKHSWKWVSGPSLFSFVDSLSALTVVNSLVQGTYIFRLTVTDDDGATATDEVKVTVNPAIVIPPPPNQPPVARAGNDVTLTLPDNTARVNGNASTDADGTIRSYVWSRISGPAYYSINNASLPEIEIRNMVEGEYIFRLTVTDDDGATGTDTIKIKVDPAVVPRPTNQPPIANAGNEIVVLLPVESATLYGTGSTDPDGIITNYEWIQLSGPSQLVIANNRASIIQVSGFMLGEYKMQLKVTDNAGATATATVKVIVRNRNGESIYTNIYPNPTQNIVNVQYVSNVTGNAKLTLYDNTNRYLWSVTLNKPLATLTNTVDLSRYRPGTYFLEIKVGRDKVTKKITKL